MSSMSRTPPTNARQRMRLLDNAVGDVRRAVRALMTRRLRMSLAVLALLSFAQGRDIRRLREWAGSAPEREQERMAQTQIVQVLLGGAAGSLGDMDPQQRQQVLQVLNAGAKFGILRYSRKHETEADHMGLFLMAAAGYDPQETVKFWERMQAATKRGGQPPQYYADRATFGLRLARDIEAKKRLIARQPHGRSEVVAIVATRTGSRRRARRA